MKTAEQYLSGNAADDRAQLNFPNFDAKMSVLNQRIKHFNAEIDGKVIEYIVRSVSCEDEIDPLICRIAAFLNILNSKAAVKTEELLDAVDYILKQQRRKLIYENS